MPKCDYTELADLLAEDSTPSTMFMDYLERAAGIRQMLEDLDRLAREDGCVAAAWAIEVFQETHRGKFDAGPTPEELADCERRLAAISQEFLDGMGEPVDEPAERA